MYEIAPLTVFSSTIYQGLTYPKYRSLLKWGGDGVVAVGAAMAGRPVGLALARVSEKPRAEILSLYVSTDCRGHGLGGTLLTTLEQELRARGCKKAELVFMTGKNTTGALIKLLRGCGWSTPTPRMLVCMADKTLLNAPFLRKEWLPATLSITPWAEVSEEDISGLLLSRASSPWFPEQLSPLGEVQFEPCNSLALRQAGDIVGWLITHRVAPDTVRYTKLFVKDELQRLGRAMPLLVNGINRQAAALGLDSKAVFSVGVDNRPMVAFLRRRMAPYLASLSETLGSYKLLSNSDDV